MVFVPFNVWSLHPGEAEIKTWLGVDVVVQNIEWASIALAEHTGRLPIRPIPSACWGGSLTHSSSLFSFHPSLGFPGLSDQHSLFVQRCAEWVEMGTGVLALTVLALEVVLVHTCYGPS